MDECKHEKRRMLRVYMGLELIAKPTKEGGIGWDVLPADAVICLDCGKIDLKVEKNTLKDMNEMVKRHEQGEGELKQDDNS